MSNLDCTDEGGATQINREGEDPWAACRAMFEAFEDSEEREEALLNLERWERLAKRRAETRQRARDACIL